MKHDELRKLKLLETLGDPDGASSQRELAQKMRVSVGLMNAFLKKLAEKGYIKFTTIPKNRIRYLITPEGFIEKSRLTYKYILSSFRYYKNACSRLENLFLDFQRQGIKRVAFFGLSDISELAYLILKETNIYFVSLIDDEFAGKFFFNKVICNIEELKYIDCEVVLVTNFDKYQKVKVKLENSQGNKKIVCL